MNEQENIHDQFFVLYDSDDRVLRERLELCCFSKNYCTVEQNRRAAP
jgi:hypothetical protein